MNSLVLYKKIESLPESMKTEVANFIEFLESKAKNSTNKKSSKPKFGSAKGLFTIGKDFDEPLEDFKE